MATNTLEILLKVSGAGKASAEIKKLDGTLSKVGGTAGATGGKFNALKTSLTSSYGEALKFAGTASAVIGALVGIGYGLKRLADGFMTYAFQVKDAARLSGATAEEMSKLIQVADDARVSVEGLTRGMWMLSQRGITPSIENLGKLADEYNTLAAGTERNTWLMEKFGRSGREMAKILELGSQKIKEMGDSIEGTGLLMTSEGIKKAEDYYAALDSLGDSAKGASLILGGELAPAITGVAESLEDVVKWHTISEASLKAFIRVTKDGIITQEEYNYIIATGYKGLEEYIKQMGLTNSIVIEYSTETEKATGATNRFTYGINLATGASYDAAPVFGSTAEQLAYLKSEASGAAGATNALSEALGRVSSVDTSQYNTILTFFNQLYLTLAGYGDLQDELDILKGMAAAAAEAGDAEGVRTLTNDIKELIIKMELLKASIGVVTPAVALANIIAAAGNLSGLLTGILSKLKQISQYGGPSNPPGYQNPPFVPPVPPGGGSTGPSNEWEDITRLPGAQYGGPVSARMPYIVGEAGPELFIPNSGGRIVNNTMTKQMIGGAKTTTIENEFNIYPPQIVDVRQLARLVTREQNRTAAR